MLHSASSVRALAAVFSFLPVLLFLFLLSFSATPSGASSALKSKQQISKRSVNFTPSWGKRSSLPSFEDAFGRDLSSADAESAGDPVAQLMMRSPYAQQRQEAYHVKRSNLLSLHRRQCLDSQQFVETMVQRLRAEINSLEGCLKYFSPTLPANIEENSNMDN